MSEEEIKQHEYVIHTLQYSDIEEYNVHSDLESLLIDLSNCLMLTTIYVIGIYQRGFLLSNFKINLLKTTARDFYL